MKIFFSAGIILVLAFTVTARPTLIQGNAFYYRGHTIEIHKYLDLFTFKSVSITSMEIPNDGSFKFTIDVPKTGLYLVHIGKINAHLFVEPGNEYTLVIPEPDEMDKFNPAKDVFIQPEIFESKDRLNYHITELEKKLNRFVIEHTDQIIGNNIKAPADSMIALTTETFKKVDSEFFRTYFHFRMAEFELVTGHSRSSVYSKYFENHAPAYDQLSFANAFLLLYNDYMYPKSPHKFSDSLEVTMNTLQFTAAMRLLSTDPFLKRQDYLQLLLAEELYHLGRERKYPSTTVLHMLDSLAGVTTIPEVRTIVTNAREILNRLAPGTKAPQFEFSDIVGNLNRISDFEGKYIYIQFFDKFTPETLRQMSLMKVLKEGYGADIAMFSISTGESVKRLREISESYNFDWLFGLSSSPDELREDYDLRALPAYFFLDEHLLFVKSPAPPPGEKIERIFAQIWNSQHPNKSLLFKLQPPEVSEFENQNPKP